MGISSIFLLNSIEIKPLGVILEILAVKFFSGSLRYSEDSFSGFES